LLSKNNIRRLVCRNDDLIFSEGQPHTSEKSAAHHTLALLLSLAAEKLTCFVDISEELIEIFLLGMMTHKGIPHAANAPGHRLPPKPRVFIFTPNRTRTAIRCSGLVRRRSQAA
jgi:hypothetical protein